MLLSYPRLLELFFISNTAGTLASSFPKPRFLGSQAVYLSANDAADNFIVALQVSQLDGSLSSPVRTLTGGKGEVDLVAISQDSVTVSGDVRFDAFFVPSQN